MKNFRMRCHYTHDEDGRKVLIPACWPVVLRYGDENAMESCSCRDDPANFTAKEFERKEFNERIANLKREKKELEKEIFRLNRIIKNLLKRKNETIEL